MKTLTPTKETALIHVPQLSAWEEVSPLKEAVRLSGLKNVQQTTLIEVSPAGNLVIRVKGDIDEEESREHSFYGEIKLQIASQVDSGLYRDAFMQVADENEQMIEKMNYTVYGLPYGWREENVCYSFKAVTTTRAMKGWVEKMLHMFTHGQDNPAKNKKITWELSMTRGTTRVIWE